MNGTVVTTNHHLSMYRLRLDDGWYAVIEILQPVAFDIGDRVECTDLLEDGSGTVYNVNLDKQVNAYLQSCGGNRNLGEEFFSRR